MKSEDQLARWVAGESIHDEEHDWCCPDFSCCQPDLLAPLEVRRKFAAASEEERMGMLMHFLGAALEKAGNDKKVHIVGQGLEQ